MPLVIPECPWFRIEEFAVSHAFPHLVEPVPDVFRKNVERLVKDVLCPLREKLGVPFTVLSGYRSQALNRAVGGSPTSQHTLAEAADIACANPELLFRTAIRMAAAGDIALGQCILYPTRRFVHCALPSKTFPRASFHVHEPAKDQHYVHFDTEDELGGLLA